MVGGGLTFISGYPNSYISLQPRVKWARCSHRRSLQTSVSTTNPSGLAKHWSWQSVPGTCPVLEQQQGLQVHWQNCLPGACALPGQCLALPLATSTQPYLWLQSKENLQGRTVLCLPLALCATWVAAAAVWRSRQRVWLAAGLGLLQAYFCNSLCSSWSIAGGCLVKLSAREIRVPACQQKVTFRMAWKSIFHVLGEMLLPASHNDLYLARTCKIVSLADCQKLHHIGVNCF